MTSLIGISGKIGSGKDTVAQIIQVLTKTNVSDVSVAHLIEKYDTKSLKNEWTVKKFAGKLKEVASLLTNIPVHKFENQEFKKTLLGNEWGRPTKNNLLNNIEPFKDATFVELMSVREFLQKLGTEAMRTGLHENVWVNATFSNYKPRTDKWLITDVRFPNEAEAIKKRHGVMLRLNRGEAAPGEHVSETALDDYEFDYVIDNNGTLEELVAKVRLFCQKYGLIEAPHYEPDHVEGFY